jgi:putative membrane protein
MSIRQSRREIFFLAVLLLASTTAFAQMGGGMHQSAPAQPQQPTPDNTATNDNANPSMPSLADQSFVEDMLKANQTQVEMSQLAQQKAFSGDVKVFSQNMIQVHTQLNQQLVSLAKQLQVSETQKPSKQEKKELDQLQQLSGQDFDTAYLQAMAKEQEHSLKEFKNEESTQNPGLQRTAKADEPVLTQNFQILQKIAETHNVTLDAK